MAFGFADFNAKPERATGVVRLRFNAGQSNRTDTGLMKRTGGISAGDDLFPKEKGQLKTVTSQHLPACNMNATNRKSRNVCFFF
jgi:hypothetical protein